MNKEKRKSLLIAVCAIAAALLVVGLAVYNGLYTSGAVQRGKVAARSENYTVDGMMFAYFYNSQYQNYASAFSYLGVQQGVSLKNQDCPYMTNGGSWFDYLVSLTRDYVINMLSLCEIGRDNGNELTAEDREEIKTQIGALEDNAKSAGYGLNEFLRLMTGNAVKKKDVEKCLELTMLAQKAYKQVMDGFSYTDDQLKAYVDENPTAFMGVDLYSHTFTAADFRVYDGDGNPTSTSSEEAEAAKKAADELASAADGSAFESTLRSILNGTAMAAEDIDAAVADAKQTHVLTAGLASEVSEWANNAVTGDATVISSDTDDAYTTYLLAKSGYLDETRARNVRHILFLNTTYEDSSKADEVYAEWEASGFSEDKFIELCNQYSEDPGSNEVGGLYENVTPGAMIDEFDSWLFDESRKPGDHALVESAQYGWHIMYYVGESDLTVWKSKAEDSLKNDDYSALLSERGASVTYNEKAANGIYG